ncbi:IclR family transcriptional regulator [Arundinibacter roseus]|uniref:IclR family transcriptional regulator n=1 Tax=Arundinibacter roseus TaxID=2070510 RepID=A0A4R4KI31_9BACT|nr:IclR family transcriptional regulator [Arundinibacter roseus]TDB67533.1 IclR family transcriptional regulator [Arundinibacter roseus]
MVQVIIRAIDILELVAQRDGHAITLTEISESLQLNQSTTANIINTVVARGYLEHIGKKKGYRLGPAAYQLTNTSAYGQELITAAQDLMEDLTRQINESCILGVLRNGKRYSLHVVNSNQEIQVQVRSERNIYETASGRLLLAYLPDKELERFVDLNGFPPESLWEKAGSFSQLKKQLEKIRQEGISFTHMTDRHVRGFAVPIYSKGSVVAGLSVFLPDYRWTLARQQEMIEASQLAARQISRRLN